MTRRPLLRILPVALSSLLLATPVALLVLGSLRRRGLPPPQGVEILPAEVSLDAYRALSEVLPVATYARNSLIVAAIAVPLTVLVASLAGFGIRLLPRRPTRIVVGITLVAMMIPVTAVWATRFEVFRLAGAIDTFVPLIAPSLLAASPFLVLIYAWSFHRLPDEQLEAARMDGAGPLRQWWSVALPQVRAASVAVVVLAFLFHWSNFIDPLLYLNSQRLFTAPLGLRLAQQLNPTDWPLLMAGATLLTLPVLVVFLAGQRFFLHDPVRDLQGRRT